MTESISQPSRFWAELSQDHRRQLDAFGIERVKRSLALRYFTFSWTDADPLGYLRANEQLRFLLARTSPWTWLRARRAPGDVSDETWDGVAAAWSERTRRRYVEFVRLLWEYARRHDRFGVCELPEPDVGSPLPVQWRGRLVSQDLANTAIELDALHPFLTRRPPRSILEIGAGYGRTAYALLRLFPEATYTVVDIQPALGVARWYLTQLFDPARLRFLTPDATAGIADASIDLVLSISSLQEMTPEQVRQYVAFADRVGSGGTVFLKQFEHWQNPVDDVTFRFDELPIPARWQQRRRARSAVQTGFTHAVWELPPTRPAREVVDDFHRLWYSTGVAHEWKLLRYLGVDIVKLPLDLWIYQELIHETSPDLIVETGTWAGGSALFLAHLCDALGKGEVVSIDIEDRKGRPAHPRLTYLCGSSTDEEIVRTVAARARDRRTMVILDSDHSRDHVREELERYAPLVTPGCYLVVEDTNVNGHPVLPEFGPGPMEAVEDFLTEHDEFEIDRDQERLLLTWNPSGYLRRR